MSHDHVTALLADRSGNLWIGTRYGLNYFNPHSGRFTRFKHNPADSFSLCDDYIASLHEDKSGTLWIGTYRGLSSWSQNDRRFINRRHDLDDPTSLSHNYCFAVHEDRQGRLWVGTGGGLNRFDRATGAFGKRKNGAMLFGGINGLNYLHPDSLQSNAFVPPVVITAFKKSGSGSEITRDVSAIKELVLSYKEHFFSFEFAALNRIKKIAPFQ